MNKVVIKQYMLNKPWPLILGGLGFLLPFIIYWFASENSGNIDKEFWSVLFSSLIFSTSMLLIFNTYQHIVLEQNGISYKSSPFSKRLSFIHKTEMSNWTIVDYTPFKKRGLGYKRDLKGNRYFVMRFGKALCVELKSGKKIFFGIQNENKTKRFIVQNWEEEKLSIYG